MQTQYNITQYIYTINTVLQTWNANYATFTPSIKSPGEYLTKTFFDIYKTQTIFSFVEVIVNVTPM